jgi:hypothetical protein
MTLTNGMRLVNINTTAWKEEDFLLYTDLTDDEIIKVIEPVVLAERENPENEENYYDNLTLVILLEKTYPHNFVTLHTIDDLDQITI